MAMRPQTDEENIASILGSGTIKGKVDNFRANSLNTKEKQRTEQHKNMITILTDGIKLGDPGRIQRATDRLIKLGYDTDSINKSMENLFDKSFTPQEERFYVTSSGKVEERKFKLFEDTFR